MHWSKAAAAALATDGVAPMEPTKPGAAPTKKPTTKKATAEAPAPAKAPTTKKPAKKVLKKAKPAGVASGGKKVSSSKRLTKRKPR